MCGVFGIISHKPVATELYEGLLHMQHRGQDMAGLLTCDERMHFKIGRGQAHEVFNEEDLQKLAGNFGIAHLRYPTQGEHSLKEAQPLMTCYPYGIGLVHNGNIVNYEELKNHLQQHRCYIDSSSDSELLLKHFAYNLANSPAANDSETLFEQICAAVKDTFVLAKGAYSIIAAIVGFGLVAFRDPHGIRPLVMGMRKLDGAINYCFASENITFTSIGFTAIGDVAPGEVVFIDIHGKMFRRVVSQKAFRPCMFEYVYFARADATINNVSVYRTRLHLGENLARAWKKKYPQVLPDVVIPVPFTSNTPALAFANELGVRYSEGLYKNAFVGRTFIMPTPGKREKSVRTKLNPQVAELKNKKVLLVDDSIVRGTTSREIVKMIREAGAREIYLASACPPLKFPCHHGINIPTQTELIANHYSDEEELAKALGIDLLLYQTLDDLQEAITRPQELPQIEQLCLTCLTGHYFCEKTT